MKNIRKVLAFLTLFLVVMAVMGAMVLPAFAANAAAPPGISDTHAFPVALAAAIAVLVLFIAAVLLQKFGVKIINITNIIAKIIQLILSGATYSGSVFSLVLSTIYETIAFVLTFYTGNLSLSELMNLAREKIKSALASVGVVATENDMLIITVGLYVGFALIKFFGLSGIPEGAALYKRLAGAARLEKAVVEKGASRLRMRFAAYEART